MITIRKWIRYLFITILLQVALTGNCSSVTALDTLRNKYPDLEKMLPRINRDLKVCDLVKKENTLLNIKSRVLENEVKQERQHTQYAIMESKKEKQKHILTNIARTVIEITAVLVLIVIY